MLSMVQSCNIVRLLIKGIIHFCFFHAGKTSREWLSQALTRVNLAIMHAEHSSSMFTVTALRPKTVPVSPMRSLPPLPYVQQLDLYLTFVSMLIVLQVRSVICRNRKITIKGSTRDSPLVLNFLPLMMA